MKVIAHLVEQSKKDGAPNWNPNGIPITENGAYDDQPTAVL